MQQCRDGKTLHKQSVVERFSVHKISKSVIRKHNYLQCQRVEESFILKILLQVT